MKLNYFWLCLLLLLPWGLLKAQSSYDMQWKTIETNKEKGLFKSNLPILKDIEEKALAQQDLVPLIRSLKEQFAILDLTKDDENNQSASQFFARLESTAPKLKGESNLLFQVLSAGFLSEYYQKNRWQIQSRTALLNLDYSQIETWSSLDFRTALQTRFQVLAQQEAALEKIQLEPYKSLFGKEPELEYVNTLWVYFSLERIEFLNDSGFFTKNELAKNQEQIAHLYKDLKDSARGNRKLFIAHRHLQWQCQLNACTDRLKQLEALYHQEPGHLDYKVKLIEDIVEQLISQNRQTDALEWIRLAESSYPKSRFLAAVNSQKMRILQPIALLSFPRELQAHTPLHFVAEHKNASAISLKLYEASADVEGFLNMVHESYDEKNFKSLKKSFLKEVHFTLPQSGDYQTHTTALALEPLKSGLYAGEYTVDGQSTKPFYFIVSRDRVLLGKKESAANQPDLFRWLNRQSGEPFAEQSLKIYESVRGKALKYYEIKTNAQGEFSFPAQGDTPYYRYYLIESQDAQGFELLSRYGDQVSRDFESREATTIQAQVFLDRGIYRPGQRVYFKAIVSQYSPETRKGSVAPNQVYSVSLVDSNGETIVTKSLTTNEFGSFHDSFILPTTVLPGQFYLRLTYEKGLQSVSRALEQTQWFRVEEYKRPNFEVVIEPLKGEYRYGETLTLRGKAVSYSGIPLGSTKVSYEIKKENIRWMYFPWFPRVASNENSILGEVLTNEQGEFEIDLTLEKDPKVQGIQVDRYEVVASVRDLTGETQSAEKAFKVASVSHYLEAQGKSAFLSSEQPLFEVKVNNYGDLPLDKSYHIKVEKLAGPSALYRELYRSRLQDLPILSESEFKTQFPYDRYEQKTLENEQKVIQTLVDGKSTMDTTLTLGKLSPGKYRLTVYNQEGEDTISVVKAFEIYNNKGLSSDQKPFLELVPMTDSLKLGQQTTLYAFSAIPEAKARFFIQNGDGTTQIEERPFKRGVAKLELSAPRDPLRERLSVRVQVSALGDVETKSADYILEKPTSRLTIKTKVFRDKLEPGQKEKWSVTLEGEQKERIQAELLATMYDKSLDQFNPNVFSWNPLNYIVNSFESYTSSKDFASLSYSKRVPYKASDVIRVPQFRWMDSYLMHRYNQTSVVIRGQSAAKMEAQMDMAAPPMAQTESSANATEEKSEANQESIIPLRENLQETAFFYPELRTNEQGEVQFEFTSPEALTQWRLQFLAHTKDLHVGILEKTVVTQKKLSLTVNYPRFLREGDRIQIKTRISSMVPEELNGTASLEILDALTLENLTQAFGITQNSKPFALKGNSSTLVPYDLVVPKGVSAILVRSSAHAGNFSDGEQMPLAILPNRKLVTEAKALFVKENQSKTYVLENLLNPNSGTLEPIRATLELTTNPIWEVLFALPSLMQDSQESVDVQFNKWASEVIAQELLKDNPRLEQVFTQYQSEELLKSNLEKNPELKELLLKETPWVLQSGTEKEQMARLARLFDRNTMAASSRSLWTRLERLQNPDGGFSWQPGSPSSYHTSLYILKNLGRLNEWLKGDLNAYSENSSTLVKSLVKYLDREVQRTIGDHPTYFITNVALNFLDARRYWERLYPLQSAGLKLKTDFLKLAPSLEPKDYTFYGLHRSALLLHQYQHSTSAKKLLTYLKETAVDSETQGLYWKANTGNWGWFSSSVANHAGALEAFNTLTPTDVKTIEELKIWLVTQKEVSHWDTSRATAEVIYQLLNSGKSWTTAQSDQSRVLWGGVNPEKEIVTKAPGYVKAVVEGADLTAAHAKVEITKTGPGVAQGGLFYQYYEDLDKIGSAASVVSVQKELYRIRSTENGEVLEPISATWPLKLGDKVKVRLILNSDRPMEYLHLKDQRAAGLEPIDALSMYRYGGGLGYYQAVRDASMDFYFEFMPKGKFVIEYELRAGASGLFSAGVASLENYYAPQMRAHTQGVMVQVED